MVSSRFPRIPIQDHAEKKPTGSTAEESLWGVSLVISAPLSSCNTCLRIGLPFSVCKTGIVHLYINNWVNISVNLPHKVFNNTLPSDCGLTVKVSATADLMALAVCYNPEIHSFFPLQPEAVRKCLQALRYSQPNLDNTHTIVIL